MKSPPVVEFVIRSSDLKKATKHLSLNRGEFKETDSADLLVSSFAATFRAIGTTTEAPVEGSHPGSVRLPLRLLVKLNEVARTYNKRELRWHFRPGTVMVEKFKMSHPDVSLGILPNQKYDLPVDAGALQTLAMASLLAPEQIVDQGSRGRVEDAQKRASTAVSNAAVFLEEFGISRKHVQDLVDLRISETALKLSTSAA